MINMNGLKMPEFTPYTGQHTFNIMRTKRSSSPWQHPYDWLENLRRAYYNQPLKYKVNPDGTIEATRSMPYPTNIPGGVSGSEISGSLGNDLTSKYILPKGSFTDEFNPNKQSYAVPRYVPSSDAERQGGYAMGLSNIGQTAALQNPNYYSPNAFRLPWRPGGGDIPVPVWGTTIDYSKGIYTRPPMGGLGSAGRLPGIQAVPQLDRFLGPGGGQLMNIQTGGDRYEWLQNQLNSYLKNRRYRRYY